MNTYQVDAGDNPIDIEAETPHHALIRFIEMAQASPEVGPLDGVAEVALDGEVLLAQEYLYNENNGDVTLRLKRPGARQLQ